MEASAQDNGTDSSPALLGLFVVFAGAMLLLMADLGFTAVHQGLSRSQVLLLIVAGALVAATGGVVVSGVRRRRAPTYILNSLLAAVTIIIGLAAAEVALRAYFAMIPPKPPYGPFEAKQSYSFRADPENFPGTSVNVHYTINELGVRGPSVAVLSQHPNPFRIITLGGSTTACTLLDDQKEWPQLLMDKLNARQRSRFVLVGNMGVNGHATVNHLAFLRKYSGPKQADLLTFLIGANDLGATLSLGGKPADTEMRARAMPTMEYPLYANTRLYQAWVRATSRVEALSGEDQNRDIVEKRRKRMISPRVPLPDLHIGLQEYRAHILEIAGACKEYQKRCVFLTQPSMFRADLTPAEDRLLWLGYVGPSPNRGAFGRPPDLAIAIDQFNKTLLSLCKEAGLECYDSAAALPHSSEAFYDDYHMNNRGAELFAEFLANQLVDSIRSSGQSQSDPIPGQRTH